MQLVKAILSGDIAIKVSLFKWSSQCPCLQTIALALEATKFWKEKIFLITQFRRNNSKKKEFLFWTWYKKITGYFTVT